MKIGRLILVLNCEFGLLRVRDASFVPNNFIMKHSGSKRAFHHYCSSLLWSMFPHHSRFANQKNSIVQKLICDGSLNIPMRHY